jgi:RNA methyltransferase, TrmH family
LLSLAQIKYVQSLQQKKFRRQHGVFVAEGEKIVSELWPGQYKVEGLYALNDWITEHRQEIPMEVPVLEVSTKDLERISGLKTPNKVLAVIKMPEESGEPELLNGALCLVLDKVQDPGNLGTIIRTADWFGIRQIICSPDTVEVFSPKVIQATMGSFLRVKIFYTELESFLARTPADTPVFGAFLEGENLFQEKTSGQGLLVIGNEAKGISEKVACFVGKKIRIPGGRQAGSVDSAESLNASVAAGIMMAWFTRK